MSFSDSDFDDFDPAGLDELEQIEIAYATGAALPPKSIVSRPGLQQRDLFGGTVAEKEKKLAAAAGPSRAGSGGGAGKGGGSEGQQETAAKVRLTKRWDLGSFAKHGWSKKKATAKKAMAKGKGKGRAYASDEEAWDDEEIIEDDEDNEATYLDPSYDPNAPLLPIKWKPDPVASKTWLYPVQADKPLRTYQYNIVHRALFADTLVSLPTGLGKTFIAACVMYAYHLSFLRSF